jgi:gluconolactonase
MRPFAGYALLAVSFLLSYPSHSSAQVPGGAIKVIRNSPILNQLIAPGVEPEVVSGGYVFTEEGGKVHAITPEGRDTVLIDFTRGSYALPDGKKTGPNAMATSRDGAVVMCEQYGRAVVRLVGSADVLRPEPFFNSYQGKRLNSPNDLVFLPDGSFFSTVRLAGTGPRPQQTALL